MKKIQKAVALLLALVLTVGAIPLSAFAAEPEATVATSPQETQPIPSESPPAETVPDPKPTEPAPTSPEPMETEPVPETTVSTEPMPTEPLVTESTVPETSAPTEPVVTEPAVPETTVPTTTAPEETTAPTEPPFVSPTPLLEDLPADFQSKVQVPEVMKDNLVLDALTELGYPVDRLRDAGILYDYNYLSILLPEAYRTGIPYGGGSTGLESVDQIRANGLVCASFLSYYLWNFLPRNGVNTTMLTENFSGNYASVPEIRGVLEVALRKALLNALCHKQYQSGVPIQISVYEDKLYIANCGCLPENWTLENLMRKHASSPYNPNIAHVFYLAGFIESWGRGVEKICSACKNDGVPQPIYTINPGDIMIEFTAPSDRVIHSGKMTNRVTDNERN